MMKRLVREIAFMVVLTILGATDLILALASSEWWISMMDIVGAIVAFVVAWLSYRDARKIAEAIAAPTEIKIIIVRPMPDAPQSETKDPEEEHEDVGHPI